MTRTRVKGEPLPTGGYATRYVTGQLAVEQVQDSMPAYSKERLYCEDLLGPDTDHPLSIEITKKEMTPLNGVVGKDSPSEKEFSKYYSGWTIYGPFNHVADPGAPLSDAEIATKVLANTNPGRSTFSVPTAVGELKDLPGLLRQTGRFVKRFSKGPPPGPSELGGWYLGYRFGWAPLLNDFKKLVDFTAMVDKRVDELNRLYDKGGLKRRVNIYTSVKTDDDTSIHHSAIGLFIYCRIDKKTKRKVWATVRWTPTSRPRYRDNSEQRNEARRLVGGINPYGAVETAWELLPWSWLIDWFTNIGDYIGSRNNSVPAVHSNVCIMRNFETEHRVSRTDSINEIEGGDGTVIYETKARSVVSGPSITAGLPFLSAGQWSILGALALNRFGRR
jgi:hypothetical protein